MSALAIFPILFTIGTWFLLLAGVPSLVLFLLMHVLSGFGLLLGTLVFALYSFFGFAALIFVAPWFFRWYFIAVGLMFGRTAMADRKEAELIAAIAAFDRTV